MEKMTKGLALEELEAHGHAELLPDRIEMHRRRGRRRRRRVRSGNLECKVINVAGLFNEAETLQICQDVDVD